MKMLARSVLIMEAFVMGFALLIARENSGNSQILFGTMIAITAILTSGLLKRKFGWILGWVVQFAMIGYGFIVFTMFFMGALFLVLWVAAIVVGKKGEAIRAKLTEEQRASKDQ